jgi:SH3-like domain-containing protein
MHGQGEVGSRVKTTLRTLKLTALLILAANGAQAAAERPTPSGLPVPRYVSLKFATVNARAGPGDDHRLLWVYHARGLPVQVVAENSEWRRVCDPEHGLAWVHKRTTDGRRTVMRLQPAPANLRRSGKLSSPITAYLQSRAIASLVRCDHKGWCKVRVDGVSGWTPATEVWGLDPKPQCG